MGEADRTGDPWTAVAPIDLPPKDPNRSEPVHVAGSGYVELPESGYGALLAWAAGLRRVRRAADRLNHQTRVTVVTGGDTTTYTRAHSTDEQDDVDNDIDSYLRDAGIPPRPPGYRWFVELPQGVTPDDLWEIVNTDLAASNATHPADVLAQVRTTLARLYSGR